MSRTPPPRKGGGSPLASGDSGDESDVLSLKELRAFVKREIDLQMEEVASPLDQKKILAECRATYGVKKMSDYAPSSRKNAKTGVHLCGCPCTPCLMLEKDLANGDIRMIRKMRGQLDPEGQE